MPDVGVLNLQIQENSESAIRGLDNLVGALERVKNAVSGGLKLSPVATGLKKIGQVVDENIHGSTIAKLGELADQLSKLSGLGNINIKITGNGAVESMRDSVREARDSMGGINTGFDEIGARAYSAKGSMEGFNSTVRDTASLMQNRAWTAGVEEFRRLFEEMSRLRMMFSLPAGAETGMSTQVEQGWTSWKNGAIEVEGTVSDTMDRVTARLGEPIPLLTDTASQLGNIDSYLGRTNDLMEEFARNTSAMSSGENAIIPYTGGHTELEDALDRIRQKTELDTEAFYKMSEAAQEAAGIRAQQESAFYAAKDPLGLDKTNNMADNLTQLDLLKAQLRDAEAAYNKFVNELGAGATKTIKAGLKVQDLRDKIWSYENALREAREEAERFAGTVEGGGGGGLNISAALGRMKDGIQKLLKPITSLVSRFKQIVKYRALRAVLRHITEGFSEGVQNVYQYSKLVGTDLAPAMDSAATTIQQFKNSIGAAVAPLIQAFIPTLKQVISVVIEGVNYLNQFFALLNGQKTWTRALPESAEAFETTKKSAKGASNAVKDLLASWDELNIIQSESSSGSGGSGTSAEEYKNMFEEVDKFSSEVEDTLAFINDHLGGLESVLKKAGIALLGWKFSKAFTGFLGTIGKLISGVSMVTLGLEISYGAGFEAGAKGYWDTQDILKGIIGGLATALGGSLITKAIGLGGGIGFGIGLTAAAIVTLVGYIQGQRDLTDKNKWGNLTMTQEEIEKFVKDQFTFDIDANINVLDGLIQNEETARRNLDEKITTFKNSLTDATVAAGISVDSSETGTAVTNAVEDAKAAITAVEGLLEANNDGITVMMKTFKFTDAEGNDITNDLLNSISIADTNVKNYFNDIGKQLAYWVTEGERKGWNEDITQSALELMRREQKVLEKAKEYKNELDFNTKLGYSMNQVIDRDTAQKQIEVQKQLINDYKEKSLEALNTQYETATELAGLARSAADDVFEQAQTAKDSGKMDMYDSLMDQYRELTESAETYEAEAQLMLDKIENIDEELAETKRKMAEKWAEVLSKVYGTDYQSDIDNVVNKNASLFTVSIGDILSDPFGDNYTLGGGFDTHSYEETAKALKDNLIKALEDGDLSGATQHYFEELNGDLFGFLDEGMRQQVANNLINALGNSSDAYQIYKHMFGLDEETAKKYIDPMYQNVWSDILKDPVEAEVEIVPEILNMESLKKDIQDAMLDGVMGTDEALDLMIKYGSTMFDQAMEELQLHLDEEGINIGKLRPRGLIASAGGLPALPKTSYMGENTQTVTTTPADNAQYAENIARGVSKGSDDILGMLTSIYSVALAISRKEFTVNVTPNSGWGAHNAKSAEDYDRVRG